MALSGTGVIVSSATGSSATTYSTMDGILSFTVTDSRDLLDITDFASGTVRDRLAGLRDFSIQLSGDLEATDAGLLKAEGSFGAGTASHTFRVLYDGTSGTAFVCMIESIEKSGSVDGKVEVSISASAVGVAPISHP